MSKLQSAIVILMLILLSGCSQPSLIRSVVPVVEPPLDQLSNLTLATSVDEVELLTTDNTRGIELSGLINTYRGIEGLPLAHWDPRLFQVALQRANDLAMNFDCWTDSGDCDRADTLMKYADAAGYDTGGVLLESAYISVGRSIDLENTAKIWQTIDAHRDNLKFKEVADIGVVIVGIDNIRVYVLVLGRE